jgi:probable selenium-dependent hydroxylase accessory protein YqeC
MPDGRHAAIPEVFGIGGRRYVHLIGGGGKTSLLFALARALAGGGDSVITTTTTRIFVPDPAESDTVVLGADVAVLVERLRGEFSMRRHVTVAARRDEAERKLVGSPVAILDGLAAAGVADRVLVEADGSAGRSLKAHRGDEPIVSPHADLAIAVIGVDCLGSPMDDAHVHRAEIFRERLGRAPGSLVTPADVAGIVFHQQGYLARVGRGCEVVVFINKAGTPQALADARRLGETLRRADRERRLGRVVMGDVRTESFEVAWAARRAA